MGERLAAAALRYARAGWAIFPLKEATKDRPLTRHGHKDATADAEAIVRLWELYPRANIGIATGKGIAVIDVDPRSGGQRDPAWPETLTARTPSGGHHLYYGVSYEVRNSASALAPGVDVRGDGGYVVGPPSFTAEGAYEWVTVRPIATAPDGLFARADRSRAVGDSYDPPIRVGEGGRNDALVRYAGWLASQGYGSTDLQDAIEDFNTGVCDPPLPLSEVEAILRRAEGWLL